MGDLVVQSGRARIEVAQDSLLRELDRLRDGAASGFLRTASRIMAEVQTEAAGLWPRRTGLSARSFRLRRDISEDRIGVTAINIAHARGVDYGYKVKFSQYTSDEVRATAERLRSGTLLPSEQRRLKLLSIAYAKRHKRRGDPVVQRLYLARLLREASGEGAPAPSLTGRGAWNWLVRRRAKQREAELIEAVRADLDRLVGGAG